MLHGLKSIAAFLGCSVVRARSLVRDGAPVRVTGRRRGGGRGLRYLAKSEALDAWVECRDPRAAVVRAKT